MPPSPYYTKKDIEHLQREYKPYLNFFQDDIFLTISEWDGVNFLDHIKSVLNNVESHLKSYKKNDSIGRQIKHAIDYYKLFPKVFELALEGKRSMAYQLMSDKIMHLTSMPFMTFNQLTHHWTNKSQSDFVYRVRVDDKGFNNRFNRNDLFHIPFEKRHLIGNNRYSLTGFPCLYFGSSVYACWEELQRPNIEDCFISKFDLTGHHLIDLTATPSRICDSLQYHFEKLSKYEDGEYEDVVKQFEYLISDYLIIWPIIFCCSIRTSYPTSVFKPEYIFPQLLLEWVVSEELSRYDGVKFMSTKTAILEEKINFDYSKLMSNYVLPARSLKATGFCDENARKLTLTNPINWQIEKLTNSELDNFKTDGSYENTAFGKLELLLDSLELKNVSNKH
ncbi:hypothetical protein JMN32_03740 [Fulvivirga sp. 29W222]|uniref:RES domain-containing protein n=1 Tax=Fulvivirga marina TaxID=2494733 RepID=A0A937FVS9_9BACT|nr:hypothetical protein [Fulvivirga marina]MBL6445403.1 hypothetical protein [Fulvivirga marina]